MMDPESRSRFSETIHWTPSLENSSVKADAERPDAECRRGVEPFKVASTDTAGGSRSGLRIRRDAGQDTELLGHESEQDSTAIAKVVPHLLPPGTLIRNRYRIERVVGIGGMAAVYLARHIEIGAPLAIKVLHESLAAIPAATERFLLESRAVSRIQNPHVVAISDYGRLSNGLPYMVMEYLQGEDLESLLEREGPLPWSRVRLMALQICEGLAAAHREGVIHRDIKPQNCYRQDGGRFGDFIKVLDFGIAEVVEDAHRSGSYVKVTPGLLAATPDYMAPELAHRQGIDHRVDIYSLGVTLFALLTGRLPFESQDASTLVRQHLTASPPRPSALIPHLGPRIDQLVLRALAKRPSDRYPSIAEFAEAIEAIDIHDDTDTLDVWTQTRRLDRPPARPMTLRWVVPMGMIMGGGVFLLAALLDPPAQFGDADVAEPSPAEFGSPTLAASLDTVSEGELAVMGPLEGEPFVPFMPVLREPFIPAANPPSDVPRRPPPTDAEATEGRDACGPRYEMAGAYDARCAPEPRYDVALPADPPEEPQGLVVAHRYPESYALTVVDPRRHEIPTLAHDDERYAPIVVAPEPPRKPRTDVSKHRTRRNVEPAAQPKKRFTGPLRNPYED